MATWSMCCTVLSILAKEHPNGLTREQLLEKANQENPSRFGGCIGMIDMVLGIKKDGTRAEHGMVSCWKEENGKILFDTSCKSYAPSFNFLGFPEIFNDWLRNNDLSHLVLYERLNPKNSERCPLGFDWESILSPGHCNWDYSKEECECHPDSGCRISEAKLKATIIRIERRDYITYYKKPLDGD